jgi:hypothetical protein
MFHLQRLEEVFIGILLNILSRFLLEDPVSLYLLRFERVDNLGAYSIPSETGLLIPSVYVSQG